MIPESAMQELRLREGQVSIRRADYNLCQCGKAGTECHRWKTWDDAELRLQGARGMLVAIYGTAAIDRFSVDCHRGK